MTSRNGAGHGVAPQRFYQPELDALRFLAFLLVFCHHSFPDTAAAYTRLFPEVVSEWIAAVPRSGGFGVSLFFTLSAYLITEILRRERASRGRIDVLFFYARRALRIWPLYFSFIALSLWVLPLLLPRESLDWRFAAAFALFVGNWMCAFQGYPGSAAALLWSVSIEEQFYLAWPFLMRWLPLRRWVPVVLGMSVLAFVSRALILASGARHPAMWCNTVAHLDAIAAGAALAFMLEGRRPALGSAARTALWLGAAVVWLVVGRYNDFEGPASLLSFPMIAGASAAILWASLSVAHSTTTVAFRGLVYLGKISYGLYVFHALALETVGFLVPGSRMVVHALLGLALTIGMAALSYRYLEEPFLRLKDRFAYVPSRPV